MQVALNDITLDDLWSLDLKKLDGWRCVFLQQQSLFRKLCLVIGLSCR